MTRQIRHEAVLTTGAIGHAAAFQLRFRSLFDEDKQVRCPCDASGHVVMDELSERARNSYLFARAIVGRLFAAPEVVAALQAK